jgi:hypothetical protein
MESPDKRNNNSDNLVQFRDFAKAQRLKEEKDGFKQATGELGEFVPKDVLINARAQKMADERSAAAKENFSDSDALETALTVIADCQKAQSSDSELLKIFYVEREKIAHNKQYTKEVLLSELSQYLANETDPRYRGYMYAVAVSFKQLEEKQSKRS